MSVDNSNASNSIDTQHASNEPFIVSFHGTFGCGKSTTSKNLAKKLIAQGKQRCASLSHFLLMFIFYVLRNEMTQYCCRKNCL
jgi:pantothenate kinase-related protein Tda10